MGSPSREQDYERLERELETGEYLKLLRDLQRGSPFLRRFTAWADVIVFMRKGTSTDPLKDEVLRPIFASHVEDADPRWRTILLVIFWPGLESLHFQKRHWDSDSDELRHNIVWIFLQVLCRIDVSQRPSRLVQKVVNDTAHCLHDEYRQIWDRANREVAADPGELGDLLGDMGINTTEMDIREAREVKIRRLREHVDEGLITEMDYLLLVGSNVYGKPVFDCAQEMGLSYAAARKRKSRAEAAIRRVPVKKDEP